MRPPSQFGDQSLPANLHHLEGSVVISKAPQDPVCWDNFDAEEIWEAIRDRRMSSGAKVAGGPSRGLAEAGDEPRRRNISTAGRWQRGVALPPPDEGGRRKDAESPDELWDDPLGGVAGAAPDFSAFGALPDDDAFDFEKMTEASKKLEEELHGPKKSDDVDEQLHSVKVDPSRPLASAGMTLSSGSGDDVNVFEDFDSPSENEVATESAPTVRAGEEDPNASSRLMKMIGVTRETPENGNEKSHQTSNPWGTSDNLSTNAAAGLDPLMSIGGASSIPLNPWGIQAATQQGELTNGNLNISPQLGSFSTEQRARDEQAAAELEKRAHEVEMFRRQKEEEAQRQAHAQKQAEEQARQHAHANAIQQQAASQQSQVELVLMERICTILENSWGRSDLVSILTTLHSEDSRVIPLLGHVDSLRALIARSPSRITLHFGGDIAVLTMTNSQWQQQQLQARLQQEEIERRRMEEAEKKNRAPASKIDPQAPWFYSDPQNNIQGPFRGDEMRQWLEAGYFKGDLPISQSPQGPFLPLSTLFPDSSVAFRAAVEEIDVTSMNPTETETAKPEITEGVQPDVSDVVVEEQASMDKKEDREIVETKEDVSGEESPNAGNQSSAQLKMILGLSTDAPPEDLKETDPPKPEKPVESENRNREIGSKNAKKSEPAKTERISKESAPEKVKQPSVAWGGVKATNPKKSMSEIQQEEARVAAMMERDNMPHQQSSGWANVAASGKSGWSSGTLKQSATITGITQNGRQMPGRGKVQNMNQLSTQRKVTPGSQNHGFESAQSSTPAEEFGTTMSQALEKWCKEQMQKISGGDDLTLVAFCMTLDDANEIRQYLTTYLGSTSQVNNFATEFISRRGLGMKQEEWETPGSARKGRKKKGGR